MLSSHPLDARMLPGSSFGDGLRGSGNSGGYSRGVCKSGITLIQWLYSVSGLLDGPNTMFWEIVVAKLSKIVRLQNPAFVRAVGLDVDQYWEDGRRVYRSAFRIQVGGS